MPLTEIVVAAIVSRASAKPVVLVYTVILLINELYITVIVSFLTVLPSEPPAIIA